METEQNQGNQRRIKGTINTFLVFHFISFIVAVSGIFSHFRLNHIETHPIMKLGIGIVSAYDIVHKKKTEHDPKIARNSKKKNNRKKLKSKALLNNNKHIFFVFATKKVSTLTVY